MRAHKTYLFELSAARVGDGGAGGGWFGRRVGVPAAEPDGCCCCCSCRSPISVYKIIIMMTHDTRPGLYSEQGY